ncbi:MAG: hypothetical protein KAU60_07820 [Desulfobacterales bacterium]|nr:hypothetical protein [Desulfobacterales bacterium]
MQEHLFYEGDLSNITRVLPEQVRKKVDEISKDQFLNTPEDDLVSHCIEALQIEPLTIYKDRMEQEHSETKVDVSGDFRRATRGHGPCYISGIQITLSLPFTGDPSLWRISPHDLFMSPRPLGRIISRQANSGLVYMIFEFPTDEQADQIRKRVGENLHYLENCIDRQSQEIDKHNSMLPDAVRQAINARRNRIQQHDKIAQILDIPLKRKPGAPEIAPLLMRKKIITQLPPPPIGGFKAEPGIIDNVYVDILKILRHEGRTWESTPKTYFVHPEEELRDMLLAHLNGHYEGAATGETFRMSGKTDIRIEDSSRAAFITECKIWEGSKKLNDGIDQLLGYLTWRDCKTAFLVINKHNANFSDLLFKIPEVFKNHSRKMKEVEVPESGEWRFVFRSKDDDSRLLYIHVFAFNLYVKL